MIKILRDDGFMAISVPHEDSIIINEHVAYFDVKRLYTFLSKKLYVLEIKILGPWILVITQKKKFNIGEKPNYFFK